MCTQDLHLLIDLQIVTNVVRISTRRKAFLTSVTSATKLVVAVKIKVTSCHVITLSTGRSKPKHQDGVFVMFLNATDPFMMRNYGTNAASVEWMMENTRVSLLYAMHAIAPALAVLIGVIP